MIKVLIPEPQWNEYKMNNMNLFYIHSLWVRKQDFSKCELNKKNFGILVVDLLISFLMIKFLYLNHSEENIKKIINI